VDRLLPLLVGARGFDDAEDIATVLHGRLVRVTAKPPPGANAGRAPRLIAGLVPAAIGAMSDEMRLALQERRELIEQRATALLDEALVAEEPWVADLGVAPESRRDLEAWRRDARTVAAYRDRYNITAPTAIGPSAPTDAQRLAAARATEALKRARCIGARRIGSRREGEFSIHERRSVARPAPRL
jgi:hypothetical protein